jgi:hypothetical protein
MIAKDPLVAAGIGYDDAVGMVEVRQKLSRTRTRVKGETQ